MHSNLRFKTKFIFSSLTPVSAGGDRNRFGILFKVSGNSKLENCRQVLCPTSIIFSEADMLRGINR